MRGPLSHTLSTIWDRLTHPDLAPTFGHLGPFLGLRDLGFRCGACLLQGGCLCNSLHFTFHLGNNHTDASFTGKMNELPEIARPEMKRGPEKFSGNSKKSLCRRRRATGITLQFRKL